MADKRGGSEREVVNFSLKGPVSVNINDEPINNSGCAILDINFAYPSQIGEVVFRNYYTTWLTVLVKTKLPNDPSGTNIGSLPAQHSKEDGMSSWITSIPKKVLMPHPHHETGSQDFVSLCCTESNVEWKDLMTMRLVLRQPSPVWRTFHVEEINVFRDIPRRSPGKETEGESIAMIIKKQTLNALNWAPKTEGQGQTGAYEFTSLPLP